LAGVEAIRHHVGLANGLAVPRAKRGSNSAVPALIFVGVLAAITFGVLGVGARSRRRRGLPWFGVPFGTGTQSSGGGNAGFGGGVSSGGGASGGW
jgi:hypothetical protein